MNDQDGLRYYHQCYEWHGANGQDGLCYYTQCYEWQGADDQDGLRDCYRSCEWHGMNDPDGLRYYIAISVTNGTARMINTAFVMVIPLSKGTA